jgi:hypothetical protein
VFSKYQKGFSFMNTGYWTTLLLYGLPITFVLGIIWGGVKAFIKEQAANNYSPDKYRS